jgi:hypothetical protein
MEPEASAGLGVVGRARGAEMKTTAAERLRSISSVRPDFRRHERSRRQAPNARLRCNKVPHVVSG